MTLAAVALLYFFIRFHLPHLTGLGARAAAVVVNVQRGSGLMEADCFTRKMISRRVARASSTWLVLIQATIILFLCKETEGIKCWQAPTQQLIQRSKVKDTQNHAGDMSKHNLTVVISCRPRSSMTPWSRKTRIGKRHCGHLVLGRNASKR